MKLVGDTLVEPEELDPAVATGVGDSVVGSDDDDNVEVDGVVNDTPIDVVEGVVGGTVLGTDGVPDPEVVPGGSVFMRVELYVGVDIGVVY